MPLSTLVSPSRTPPAGGFSRPALVGAGWRLRDDERANRADKNPLPLCAELEFGDNALPYTKIQIKLAESMRIRAVARTADGKNHVAFRDIKVTLSGC